MTQKWLHLPEWLPLPEGRRLPAVIQEAGTGGRADAGGSGPGGPGADRRHRPPPLLRSQESARWWPRARPRGTSRRSPKIRLNCAGDQLLLRVRPAGGACELGYQSCFFRRLGPDGWEIADPQVFDPAEVYPEIAFSH